MKRRLDLGLALVHSPRILFLDEPTTGLDPQSRSALWEEVGRLAKEEGVTVFLTTQYLEEADVLSDRVGIIDHGRIVAEGTPAALKAELARPTVRILRQPAYVIAPLGFPLALFAVNSAGLAASTHLPGFPAKTFLAFALAVPFVQGALISTLSTGTELARDIQTGFLNRLQL